MSPSVTNKMKGIEDLAKSASFVLIGTIVGQILGFLGELLIIQSVSPDTLGYLGLAYAVVSILGTIALFGVPAGVTRLLSAKEKGESVTGILPAGYLIGLLSSTALAFVLFLLRDNIADLANNPNVGSVLPLFLPYLLVLPIARISFSALRADQRTIPATLSKWIGPRTVAIFLLAGFVFLLNRPTMGAIVYWLSIPALISVLSLWFLRDGLSSSKVAIPTQNEMRELWRFSWPLAVSVSLTMLLTRLDILMLGIYVDATSVGYYRAIQPLRQIPTFIAGAFGFLFLPLATKYYESNELQNLNQLYLTSTKWIASLTLPFILVFTLFSSDVIRVFFGEQYVPASSALSILIAGLFFRALVGLDTDLLKALDRTKVELVCALVGVVFNVVLNILLIPRFGIAGAATATVIGFFAYNICELSIIYKQIGIHPFGLNNLKPIFPTTVASVGIWILLNDESLGLLSLILTGIVFSAFHAVSLVVTRSLDENDLFLIEKFEARTDIDLTWLTSTIQSRS